MHCYSILFNRFISFLSNFKYIINVNNKQSIETFVDNKFILKNINHLLASLFLNYLNIKH
jgi:hypothetical protein